MHNDVPTGIGASSLVMVFTFALVTVLPGGCDRAGISSAPGTSAPAESDREWDLAVLGRVHLCGVCQRGTPNLSYTKVLAGAAPNGRADGALAIAGVAPHILPAEGIPLYESEHDEIVLLVRVEDGDLYSVVDVLTATPENLALFRNR